MSMTLLKGPGFNFTIKNTAGNLLTMFAQKNFENPLIHGILSIKSMFCMLLVLLKMQKHIHIDQRIR